MCVPADLLQPGAQGCISVVCAASSATAHMGSGMGVAELLREAKMIFMTSMWLFCCLQYFLPFLVILPISLVPGIGVKLYRKLHDILDPWIVVITMTVPFSWCGCRLCMRGFSTFQKLKQNPDGLVLSTHCSRIDWLIGTYLSVLCEVRVGFVAEATTAIMPIIGWQRHLAGDIFVMRAFHKDQPMIEANIRAFKESCIRRVLFLAPEGFVADPGSDVGDKYLPLCDEFMQKEGREPLTHLLTPRYKGTSVFVKHAPDNIISCAMAYVEDAVICEETCKLIGGELCTRGLRDPRRTIPDLHSVFRGGLAVFIQGGELKLDASDPEVLKKHMLDDQQMKDRMLRVFEETGLFFNDEQRGDYYVNDNQSPAEVVPAPHFFLNAYFVVHTTVSCGVLALLLGISMWAAAMKMLYTIFGIFLIHTSTHYLARLMTGGHSTESLCGETAIKALIDLAFKIIKLIKGKKKDKDKAQ